MKKAIRILFLAAGGALLLNGVHVSLVSNFNLGTLLVFGLGALFVLFGALYAKLWKGLRVAVLCGTALLVLLTASLSVYGGFDNTTGEVVLAKTVEGSKSGSTVTDAFNNACKTAAENFLKELDGLNPFRARVADVYGSDIYIDQGSESGLRRGETLIVAREGAPIVVNGRVVAMRQTEIGKVKVVEVNADYAVCRPEDNTSGIQKGDVVKRS